MVTTPTEPSSNPSSEIGDIIPGRAVSSHSTTIRGSAIIARSGHSIRISSGAESKNSSLDLTDESFGESNRNKPKHFHSHYGKFEIKNTWADAKDYDFVGARGERRKCNIIESIGHLVKSCLGAGIVAMHESYKSCGLWTALVLNVLLGIAVGYCMLHAFVFCNRFCVAATLAIDLFGSCCVYQVVMARTLKQLVDNSQEVYDSGNPPIRVYILCILVPCILICMLTTLKYLAPFSIVADIFIIIVTLATVYYGVYLHTISPLDFKAFHSMAGLFELMGVCVFSVEGVGVTLVIENSMQEPRRFPVVLIAGMSIVIAMVMMVGFFGYWGFGEKSKSPVTVNFPLTVFPIILKVFLALMIYVDFALNFYLPFGLVWQYLKERHHPNQYWLMERVYRALFVLGVTLVAIIFPNISKFMGVLGSFCLSSMGFIFPALIQLSLTWEDPGLGYMRWRLIRFFAILIFGVTMGTVGTLFNLVELIREVYY